VVLIASIIRTITHREAINTSETSVSIYETARRNIREGSHLYTRCRENLKSHSDSSCARCFVRNKVPEIKVLLHVAKNCSDWSISGTGQMEEPSPYIPDLEHLILINWT
jgi:hypothetical protein